MEGGEGKGKEKGRGRDVPYFWKIMLATLFQSKRNRIVPGIEKYSATDRLSMVNCCCEFDCGAQTTR